jgi:uncharacterized membrane protein YdjX (TVP38/TMEM64 family)
VARCHASIEFSGDAGNRSPRRRHSAAGTFQWVITFSGRMLGFWGRTAASWCGMTAGAIIAFGLVRAYGRPLVQRLTRADELERVNAMAARTGVLALVLARPIPVLAEASVMLMATTGLAWWRFAAAVSLSNLGIAATYSALGDSVTLPVAIVASIALPFLIGWVAGLLWPRTGPPSSASGHRSSSSSFS